jgi:hypothetical protein
MESQVILLFLGDTVLRSSPAGDWRSGNATCYLKGLPAFKQIKILIIGKYYKEHTLEFSDNLNLVTRTKILLIQRFK